MTASSGRVAGDAHARADTKEKDVSAHHTHVQASSVNDSHSESRVSVRTSPSYVSSPNKVAYSWSVSQLMIDVSTTKLVYATAGTQLAKAAFTMPG